MSHLTDLCSIVTLEQCSITAIYIVLERESTRDYFIILRRALGVDQAALEFRDPSGLKTWTTTLSSLMVSGVANPSSFHFDSLRSLS